MNRKITVIGSSNTDMVIQLDRLPRPGETLLGGKFLTAPGGKGANQAVGAARAGGEVSFVARVGTDVFGDQAVRGFKEAGISVDYVFRDQGEPSGVALIFVARDGENSIAVASGANARLSPADVKRARKVIQDSAVVLMQLETPLRTVEAAARVGNAGRARVILNPAPAQRLPARLLSLVSIITPNETEAELLTGIKVEDPATAGNAAAKLHASGVRTVIITLGRQGAFLSEGETKEIVPGYRVKAVDTTAAGDIFNGALAVALAERRPLREAVQFANAAAAISVTRLGAQPSAPSRREIERLLRRRE